MDKITQAAVENWKYVAPLLRAPMNQKDCDRLIAQLDSLLDLTGGKENHSLNSLIELVSDHIAEYEKKNFPEIESTGIDVLKELMAMHELKQSDLSHIASQGVMSEILNGKRNLNLRQIKLLAAHFGVDPSTLI